MTKWRFLIISFLLVFVACSNRNSITVAVKKLYGRSIKINWDDEVIIKKESSPSTPYHMRPVKILLSFDANECIECFRNNIVACANYSDHLPKEYVSIICLVPFRREDIIANVCDLYLSDLCIISDVDNQFAKTNKVEEYNSFFRSYLINKNDRIVLVGNPLRNQDLKELYEKTIKELLSDCTIKENHNLSPKVRN